MALGGRFTKVVPATILGIAAGILAYAAIAVTDESLRQLDGNTLVIGELGTTGQGYLT